MALFHIQDADRPAYVVAKTYAEAERKWRAAVAAENDGDDGGPPAGIYLVCDDRELIVDHDWYEAKGGGA